MFNLKIHLQTFTFFVRVCWSSFMMSDEKPQHNSLYKLSYFVLESYSLWSIAIVDQRSAYWVQRWPRIWSWTWTSSGCSRPLAKTKEEQSASRCWSAVSTKSRELPSKSSFVLFVLFIIMDLMIWNSICLIFYIIIWFRLSVCMYVCLSVCLYVCPYVVPS